MIKGGVRRCCSQPVIISLSRRDTELPRLWRSHQTTLCRVTTQIKHHNNTTLHHLHHQCSERAPPQMDVWMSPFIPSPSSVIITQAVCVFDLLMVSLCLFVSRDEGLEGLICAYEPFNGFNALTHSHIHTFTHSHGLIWAGIVTVCLWADAACVIYHQWNLIISQCLL